MYNILRGLLRGPEEHVLEHFLAHAHHFRRIIALQGLVRIHLRPRRVINIDYICYMYNIIFIVDINITPLS